MKTVCVDEVVTPAEDVNVVKVRSPLQTPNTLVKEKFKVVDVDDSLGPELVDVSKVPTPCHVESVLTFSMS